MLTKTDYSDWASPAVYMKKKNDKIRACADFSTKLNDCLEIYNHPLPKPEDIIAKLSGRKVFPKLDLSEGYLQIPIDEEYTKYLTISKHKDLYGFNRLLFGSKVIQGIF